MAGTNKTAAEFQAMLDAIHADLAGKPSKKLWSAWRRLNQINQKAFSEFCSAQAKAAVVVKRAGLKYRNR